MIKMFGLFFVAGLVSGAYRHHKPAPQIEQVFSDSVYQLTGVAVPRNGRMFTNYTLLSDIYRWAVMQIKGSKQNAAYPDVAMNAWKAGGNRRHMRLGNSARNRYLPILLQGTRGSDNYF